MSHGPETEVAVEAKIGSPFDGPLGHELARVMTDVARERERQIGLGYDAAHDDDHQIEELVDSIDEQLDQAWEAAEKGAFEEARRRLVQAAAIAVATIEVIDRHFAHGINPAGSGPDPVRPRSADEGSTVL